MANAKPRISETEIENWLVVQTAAEAGVSPADVDVRAAFNLYLNSAAATALTARLAKVIGHALPLTLFWDHTSIRGLVAHLNSRDFAAGNFASDIQRSAAAKEKSSAQSPIHYDSPSPSEPIALIGMACRFPGGGNTPELYWDLLARGRNAVQDPPPDRGHLNIPGGYLRDVYDFDPEFFGIHAGEALHMDPQQRLVLELAWQGLEDAGLPPSGLRGRRVGVFMGAMWNEYNRHQADLTAHSATGEDTSIISARIAYWLGLRGPALTINTACSSSLSALHTAVQHLQTGEIETAIAGGVSLILSEHSGLAMSRFGALSPKHRCAPFDADADGYARGEGGGLVVLKPLSHALRDGNSIYCLLLGGAMNNDGASNGLTAPNGAAQEDAIRRALSSANLDPKLVQYVETHGTGTRLGDPIEAAGLGAVYGTADREALRIGSVKSNLGHLEAASGIAGLIKTALALNKRLLPPSLHFHAPNPHIDFRGMNLNVQTQLSHWPSPNKTLTAGVSSFGFGGTNVHMILGEFPPVRMKTESDSPAPNFSFPKGKTATRAFIFSGGGHQWRGMCRELLSAEPVFFNRVRECDEIVNRLAGWSVLQEIISGENQHRTDIMQPVLTAIQLGLAELWRERGFAADVVLGHSGGEPAAACFAGILSVEQAMEIVVHRGVLQYRTHGRGGMLHANMDFDGAMEALRTNPGCSLAAVNGPRSLVFSGDIVALEKLRTYLDARGASPRGVRVDFAAHSPEMDPLKEEFFRLLRHIRPMPADIPMLSPLDGRLVKGSELDAHYWARNIRDTVRFDLGVRALLDRGTTSFLEISAHPILAHAVREWGEDVEVLASMRRGESQLSVPEIVPGRATDTRAPAHLFTISARDARGLKKRVEETLRRIDEEQVNLTDLCRTNIAGREHMDYRWAVGTTSLEDLRGRLEQFISAPALTDGPVIFREKPRLAFVFSGQGSEWQGMSRELFELEPEFRARMRHCDEIFHSISGWSILRTLREVDWNPGDTAIVQACLFAYQTSLAALLRARDIQPDVVVGHSLGEIAAAHDAGILSLENALRLVHHRGLLMSRREYRGRMLEAEISEDETARLLENYAGRITIAARNSPGSIVFSGATAAIRECRSYLRDRGIPRRLLRTRYAFHGPKMHQVADGLRREAAALKPEPSETTFYSTITTNKMSGLDLDADYWGRNAAEPVLFAQTIENMAAANIGVFLEISPRAVLSHSLRRTLDTRKDNTLVVPLIRRGREESQAFMNGIAELHRAGYPLRFESFSQGGRLLRGGGYPWDRKTFRLGNESAQADANARTNANPNEGRKLGGAKSVGYYQVEWRPREDTTLPESVPRDRSWIVIRDAQGAADALHALLRNAGENVVLHERSALLESISESAPFTSGRRPIIVCPLNFQGEGSSPRELPDITPLTILVSALADKPADLWLLTAGMLEPNRGHGAFADPDQAAAWGLVRTLALETNQCRVRIADLTSAAATPSSPLFRERAERLLAIMRDPGEDEQFLVGSRKIFYPVLRNANPPAREVIDFRSDAAYLITGGTGDIGRLLAARILERGAGRVYLAARKKPLVEKNIALTDERIVFIKCDVTHEDQVRELITTIGPNLRGVFHAAGNMQTNSTADNQSLSAVNIEEVLGPKVRGLINLHEATNGFPLDYFACFSSAANIWGAAGLGIYAAANAFMDAFMEHRRAQGLSGLTVNFGPWRDVGMVQGNEITDGVVPGDAREYLDAFLQLLETDTSHFTVANLNRPRFTKLMRARGRGRFVSEIAGPREKESSIEIGFQSKERQPDLNGKGAKAKSSNLSRELKSRSPALRSEYLNTYLRELIRSMLNTPSADLSEEIGFFQLGMDSLMTVELRNHLEQDLDTVLSPTALLENPNIRALSQHLLAVYFNAPSTNKIIEEPQVSPRSEIEAENVPNILKEVTRISDGEILRNLRGG